MNKIKKTGLTSWLIIFLVAGSFAGSPATNEICREEGIVSRKDWTAPESWQPRKIGGRDFWNMLNHKCIINAQTAGIKDRFWEESAIRFALFGSINYQVAVRELEIYSPVDAKNQALGAKPIAGGKINENATVLGAYVPPKEIVADLSCVNDGNTNTAAYSSYIFNFPVSGWIGLDFAGPVEINKAVVYHGLGTADYANVSDHFVLQYWDSGNWTDIPGTETKNNRQCRTEHLFNPVKTAKIRVFVFSQILSSTHYAAGEEWQWWFKKFTNSGLDYESRIKTAPFVIETVTDFFRETSCDPVMRAAYESLNNKFSETFLGFWTGEWPGSYFFRKFEAALKQEGTAINRKTMADRTREEFIKLRKKYFNKFSNMCSNFLINHQQLEWGGGFPSAETTQTAGLDMHQAQVMFTRGAARQYDKIWQMYIAFFLNQVFPCYDSNKKWTGRGPDSGISPSLYRRILYAFYMSGANLIDHETVGDVLITTDQKKSSGLSPHGKVLREWFNFTRNNPDRGITYAPIGLMLDYYEGFSPSIRRMWYLIDNEKPDNQIYEFVQTIFPADIVITNEHNGVGLVNTPWGDIFDVMVPNPPSGIIDQARINNYKVNILLGKIDINRDFADKLKQYVREGGTLVMDVDKVNKFIGDSDFLGLELKSDSILGEADQAVDLRSKRTIVSRKFSYRRADLKTAKPLFATEKNIPLVTINEYGQGKVVLFLTPCMLDQQDKIVPFLPAFLDHIAAEALPVKINGDVEYIINKTKDGWLITLINNKGVYKEPTKAPVVKEEEKAEVEILFKKAPVKISELIANRPVERPSDNTAKVVVPSGDVVILKIVE